MTSREATVRPIPRRTAQVLVLALACALAVTGVADARRARRAPLCDTTKTSDTAPTVVVFSAFPAELASLATAAQVDATVQVDDRSYYVGHLEGVRVVLGLTGIGLVNADARSRSVLDHFRAAAVLFSGVAGSPHRIGDVVVPDDWMLATGTTVYPVNPALAALAVRASTALPTPLEQCTLVPPTDPHGALVCMPFMPAVVLGGHGVSSDPYNGAAPCAPGGGDVAGCELPPTSSPSGAMVAADTAVPDVSDMETAAVAAVAADRGVPFLAMRAVSDGAGDPKGDRGFPAQFFDYYKLAAHNAAITTRAVLARIANLSADRKERRICRLLARRQWTRAAKRIVPQ
jgi:nucleoside phosphorylase